LIPRKKVDKMNYAILFQIFFLCCARIIEAIRDAEAFDKPNEERSLLWHILKIPQYMLLAAAGAACFHTPSLAGGMLAVFFAWVVFEVTLKGARNRND